MSEQVTFNELIVVARCHASERIQGMILDLRQQLEALAEKWENAAGSKSEQPYIRATADTIKECAAELRALLK